MLASESRQSSSAWSVSFPKNIKSHTVRPKPHLAHYLISDTGWLWICRQKHKHETRIKQDFPAGSQPYVGEDESDSEIIFLHLIISSRVFFQEYLITFGIPVRC